ncbi:MAG: histidine kinase [Hyphomicrobiales bacterium]|nr:histidine kinase [Hyphomicrobiales bacterium]
MVAIAAGFLSFRYAFDEAIELQDDQLRQTAAWLQRQHFHTPPTEVAGLPDADPESRLIVLTAEPQGGWQPQDAAPGLRADLADGFQTVAINGAPWRFFIGGQDRGLRVAVGQQTAVRDEIANKSALRTDAPLLSLILILPLMVGFLIRRMLRPLRKMAADLELRSELDWRGISADGLPSEIRPFVVAIKRLLARVAASVAAQRRFVADAAHELRSPLTALSLQAERLDAAEMPAETRLRLMALRRGIGRTRRLLDQLLALARAQTDASEPQPVSFVSVFRAVLEDLMPLAEAKDLDVGVTSQQDVVVRWNEVDLTMLVRNLVDNAIRYTPEGGRIDLAIEMRPEGAKLRVDDTGPGIPPQDREQVFDPFHRLLGNDEVGAGLGLSIVKAIADRIGADVSLGQSDGGGLSATVTIPKSLVLSSA